MDILQLINTILVGLFFGFLSAYFAKRRGRRPLVWFLIGFSCCLLGFLVLLFLPRVAKAVPSKMASAQRSPFKTRSDAWLKMWYYLEPSRDQKGPFEFPDLIKFRKDQVISERSYVWGEGMKEWKPLSDLPELMQEMDRH